MIGGVLVKAYLYTECDIGENRIIEGKLREFAEIIEGVDFKVRQGSLMRTHL